jgi:Bacteriocin-protection, YdeI or OmpD-Associated/Domain of unknown function (DUF1905)
MARQSYRFQATIYRIWMMRHVDVPDEIARDLQKQMGNGSRSRKGRGQAKPKYIPVAAIVNGKGARTTLVPAGGGRFRMLINTALRKAARADVGDLVGVELRLDRASRALPIPADLEAALEQHPKAWKAFQALAPGHLRHFIQWFDSAKSLEARSRRLDRAIDALLERALSGPRRDGKHRARERLRRDSSPKI